MRESPSSIGYKMAAAAAAAATAAVDIELEPPPLLLLLLLLPPLLGYSVFMLAADGAVVIDGSSMKGVRHDELELPLPLPLPS